MASFGEKTVDKEQHMPLDATPTTGPRLAGLGQASCASVSAWHCVYTKPKAERDADRALALAGFQTFLPRYQMVWRDRTKVIRPLFPRYTFVRFNAAADPWRIVVRDRVGREAGEMMLDPTTRRPHAIPDAIVDALMAQTAADGVIYPPEPRQMRRGDVGKVLAGPLAEFSGICSRTTKDRVWLLLSILGRPSEVGFARDVVELAPTG